MTILNASGTASVIIIVIFSLCTFSYAWLVYVGALGIRLYQSPFIYRLSLVLCVFDRDFSLQSNRRLYGMVEVPLYSSFPHAFIRKTYRKVVVVGARA